LYGEPSDRVLALSGDAQDIRAGEHAALWPLMALIVLMGVLSPWWMRAIDQAVGAPLAALAPHPTDNKTVRRMGHPEFVSSRENSSVRQGN